MEAYLTGNLNLDMEKQYDEILLSSLNAKVALLWKTKKIEYIIIKKKRIFVNFFIHFLLGFRLLTHSSGKYGSILSSSDWNNSTKYCSNF